ncbi:hypothetical protein J2S19_004502 [Metabacillus malikii]|uniref:Uncharacterized protein n=1 Tax=Metabacillus malikii TaxID=1504265 RepID=A0ABT9ZLJ7_9BACI|nr:hypothetical protein [Metabacillus malikii]
MDNDKRGGNVLIGVKNGSKRRTKSLAIALKTSFYQKRAKKMKKYLFRDIV